MDYVGKDVWSHFMFVLVVFNKTSVLQLFRKMLQLRFAVKL